MSPYYKRFPTYEELYPNGELSLNSRNLEALNNLVSVVISKYFKGYGEIEEFQSIGMLKAIELLESNSFDRNKYTSSQALKNFLFTGIRNSISNYIYHYLNLDKELVLDILPENNKVSDDSLDITRSLVDKFINSVSFDIDKEQLYSYLSYLGFHLSSKSFKGNEYKYKKYSILFIKYYFNNI